MKTSTQLRVIGWFINIATVLAILDGVITNDVLIVGAVIVANMHLVGADIAKLIEGQNGKNNEAGEEVDNRPLGQSGEEEGQDVR